MADSSVKTISITGNAAQLGTDGARRKNTRKSRKEESNITYFPTKVPNLMAGGSPPVAQPSLPQPPPQPATNIPPPAPIYPPKMGGASTSHLNTKLILSPPKKKETRLLLKAPKQVTASAAPEKTRKAVRKIKLGLRGLTTKIHRATRIHKRVKDMKKEDIEQLLKEKGLLKTGKKAPPEALMRQMYSDYLLLTSRGL